jgi:probable HAF family extracellular repeat protein
LGGDNSIPIWINNSGVVVGLAETGEVDPITGFAVFHAVRWEQGVPQDLGTLGGNNSVALFVNENGEIVGFSENSEC